MPSVMQDLENQTLNRLNLDLTFM